MTRGFSASSSCAVMLISRKARYTAREGAACDTHTCTVRHGSLDAWVLQQAVPGASRCVPQQHTGHNTRGASCNPAHTAHPVLCACTATAPTSNAASVGARIVIAVVSFNMDVKPGEGNNKRARRGGQVCQAGICKAVPTRTPAAVLPMRACQQLATGTLHMHQRTCCLHRGHQGGQASGAAVCGRDCLLEGGVGEGSSWSSVGARCVGRRCVGIASTSGSASSTSLGRGGGGGLGFVCCSVGGVLIDFRPCRHRVAGRGACQRDRAGLEQETPAGSR